MRRPHPDRTRLFFSIPKLISFKKLNGTGWDEDGKILKPSMFTFDVLYLLFYFYYIKINVFHKKIKIL